jgi:hypothetical protein
VSVRLLLQSGSTDVKPCGSQLHCTAIWQLALYSKQLNNAAPDNHLFISVLRLTWHHDDWFWDKLGECQSIIRLSNSHAIREQMESGLKVRYFSMAVFYF